MVNKYKDYRSLFTSVKEWLARSYSPSTALIKAESPICDGLKDLSREEAAVAASLFAGKETLGK